MYVTEGKTTKINKIWAFRLFMNVFILAFQHAKVTGAQIYNVQINEFVSTALIDLDLPIEIRTKR